MDENLIDLEILTVKDQAYRIKDGALTKRVEQLEQYAGAGGSGGGGTQGAQGPQGEKGDKGDKGDPGNDGADGKSAYEIWLDAGNQGTEADFLNAIKGAKGDKGDKGDSGAPGTNGTNGTNGADGKSAYEIWLDAGNQGTETDFLNALKGAKGDKGDKGDSGNDGANGTNGSNGADGKSAYQIWLDAGNQGTETDFLNAIKGAKGDKGDKGDPGNDGTNGTDGANGADGKSAYQIWLDAGNQGTETDFLNSLKGEKGDKGEDGNGTPYEAGENIRINGNVISANFGSGLKQVNLREYEGSDGEIVQHVDSTDAQYTHGYIYEKVGEEEYNTVTIPSDSTKYIFTNKFDGSQKVYYKTNTVVSTYQGCSLCIPYMGETRASFDIHVSDLSACGWNERRRVSDLSPCPMYSPVSTVLLCYIWRDVYGAIETSYSKNWELIKSFCADIIGRHIPVCLRDNIDNPVVMGVIDDFLIAVKMTTKDDSSIEVVRYSFLDKGTVSLETIQTTLIEGYKRLYGKAPSNPTFSYRLVVDANSEYSGTNFDSGIYATFEDGRSGQIFLSHKRVEMKKADMCVSENGNVVYIAPSTNGELPVILSFNPTIYEANKITDNDPALFFDYTLSTKQTTEVVRLRQKVVHYDANGNVIDDVYWQRIDVQPSTVGRGIFTVTASSIDNNLSNVDTANLNANDILIVADLSSATPLSYKTSSNATRTLQGNPDFDVPFRYVGNGVFKPIAIPTIIN